MCPSPPSSRIRRRPGVEGVGPPSTGRIVDGMIPPASTHTPATLGRQPPLARAGEDGTEEALGDGEIFIFIIFLVASAVALGTTRTGSLHRLYFRGNPGPGIVRLGVLGAMGWIWWVLMYRADPSVTGVYTLFYLVMGFALVKHLGQSLAAAYGARFRVDVVERRNVPAALFIATFILCTGLIFGGSLWGEADPVGDDEGGWWIPLTFFFLGWGCLLGAFALFLRREKGRLRHRVRRERSMEDVRPAVLFLLAAAVTLTDAVAGDFWGWRHGLLTFGVLALLVVAHQAFANMAGPSRPGEEAEPITGRRLLESGAYALLGLSAWGLNRILDLTLGAG